jgi:hypothetical protein
MLVTILLGSDKTTVSVATGQNDYYPLYMSVGNISNRARRAYEDGVIVIGFLAIPKGVFIWYLSCHVLNVVQPNAKTRKAPNFVIFADNSSTLL